jgi:integrase
VNCFSGNGTNGLKDVKAEKRRRRIDLAAVTVAALNDHRQRMLAEGRDVKAGLGFCAPEGGNLRNSDVRELSFKPTLKKAGLPGIRLYDLRHTCATLLLLAEENPKVVSERLGHSTITLTMDTYSHVLPTMQQRAAEKMNLILGRKPQDDKKAAQG